jgi:hypothetical protein
MVFRSCQRHRVACRPELEYEARRGPCGAPECPRTQCGPGPRQAAPQRRAQGPSECTRQRASPGRVPPPPPRMFLDGQAGAGWRLPVGSGPLPQPPRWGPRPPCHCGLGRRPARVLAAPACATSSKRRAVDGQTAEAIRPHGPCGCGIFLIFDAAEFLIFFSLHRCCDGSAGQCEGGLVGAGAANEARGIWRPIRPVSISLCAGRGAPRACARTHKDTAIDAGRA